MFSEKYILDFEKRSSQFIIDSSINHSSNQCEHILKKTLNTKE